MAVAKTPSAPPASGEGADDAGKPKPKRRPTGYDGVPGGNGTALSVKVALPLRPEEAPPPRTGFPYVTPLKELCLESVARDFHSDPSCVLRGVLPKSDVDRIVALLRVDIPLELAGEAIPHESYWRRRAFARWPSTDPVDRGRSWKQLYFERNLEDALGGEGEVFRHSPKDRATDATDEHAPVDSADSADSADALRRLVAFSRRWCRRLRVVAAPGSVDLASLLDACANSLVALSLEYRPRSDVGMAVEKTQYGMLLGDCRALAKALECAETLAVLTLASNRLNDDKTRMLASGLARNLSVTRLDLSRNDIACAGAEAVAALLTKRSALSFLELGDNDIGARGAAALARAVARGAASRALQHLSLRRNRRVGDEGGAAIADALADASARGEKLTLRTLDLSACGVGARTAAALARLLERNDATLVAIKCASNAKIGEEGEERKNEALDAGDGEEVPTESGEGEEVTLNSGEGEEVTLHSGEGEEVPTETAEGEEASDSEVKEGGVSGDAAPRPSAVVFSEPAASLVRAARANTHVRELDFRACGLGAEVEAALEEVCSRNVDAAEARGGIDGGAAGRVGNAHFLEDLAPSVVSLH